MLSYYKIFDPSIDCMVFRSFIERLSAGSEVILTCSKVSSAHLLIMIGRNLIGSRMRMFPSLKGVLFIATQMRRMEQRLIEESPGMVCISTKR